MKNKLREAEKRKNEKVVINIDMIKRSWFIPKYEYVKHKLDESKPTEEIADAKELANNEEEEEQNEEGEQGEEIQVIDKEEDAEEKDEQESDNEPSSPNKEESGKQNSIDNETEILEMIVIEPTEEEIYSLETMHLEFKNISDIEGLERFIKLENLYLQHNKIVEIKWLDQLVCLQFLALQNNLIKEVKGLKQLTNLAFLNLSYNKIKEFDIDELPKNLFVLKLRHNPWEKLMPDYRKSIVLHWERLEDLDGVSVHVAERMHYQGIIEINLDSQLTEIKNRKIEEEIKSKLEDELMQEILNENGLTEEEEDKKEKIKEKFGASQSETTKSNRQENWDSFQRLDEFVDLQKGFMKIKKEIKKNQKIVKNITSQRKKVLYDHYKTLEKRYLADNEKQALVEEYK